MAKGARSSKLKAVNGKLVSAKSRTGDPVCSQAMSDWKLNGMTPVIAAILGKCRSSARSKKKADMHEAAGNDGKAAILRRKAENTAPTNAADRLARARALRGQRAEKMAGKAKASPAGPTLMEQAAKHRAGKGLTTDQRGYVAATKYSWWRADAPTGRQAMNMTRREQTGMKLEEGIQKYPDLIKGTIAKTRGKIDQFKAKRETPTLALSQNGPKLTANKYGTWGERIGRGEVSSKPEGSRYASSHKQDTADHIEHLRTKAKWDSHDAAYAESYAKAKDAPAWLKEYSKEYGRLNSRTSLVPTLADENRQRKLLDLKPIRAPRKAKAKPASPAPSVPARTGPSRLQSLIKSKSAATVNAGVARRTELAKKGKASPVMAPGRGTAERLSGAKQVREFRAKQGLSGRAAIVSNESARKTIASNIPTSASANRLGRGMDKDSIRGARERLMAGDKKFQAGDARMRSFDGRKDRVKQYADNKRNFAANQRNAYFKDDGAVQSLDASKAAEARFGRGISADNKISDAKKRLSGQLNARMVSEARFPRHAAVQPAPVAAKSGPSKLQSLIKAKSAGVVKAGVSRREHRPADRAAILQRATEHRASKGTIATRSATVSSRINDKRNQVIDSAKTSGGKLSQSGQDRAGLLLKRDMKVRGFMNRGQFAKLQPKGQPTPQVGWGDSPVKMAVPTSLLTYDNPALKQAKSAPSVPARTGPSRLQSLIKSKSAATVNAGVARRTELAKKGTELAVKPPMTLKEQVAYNRAKKEHMAWAEETKYGRMKNDTPATHGRKHRADMLARRALKVQKTARRKQLAAIKAKKYDVAKHNREAYETNFARKENLFVASGHLQLRAPKEQTGVDQSMTGARWVTAQNVQTVAPAAPAAPAAPKGPSKLQSLIKSKSASVVKTGAAKVEKRAATLKAAAEFRASKGNNDQRYWRALSHASDINKGLNQRYSVADTSAGHADQQASDGSLGKSAFNTKAKQIKHLESRHSAMLGRIKKLASTLYPRPSRSR